MNKEYLEAFGLVKRTCELYIETTRFLKGSDIITNQIKEALNTIQNRLEAIDNANPSEALEELELVENWIRDRELKSSKVIEPSLTIIKQALLKVEENAKSEEILQKYYQEGITLDSVRALKQEKDSYKKILEIIKEKRIDIESFYSSFIEREFTYDFYSSFYGSYGRNKLTKEEFNLMIEVLE